jgi:hypothetical protein
MEAESQAVLNTLTDAFKKRQKRSNGAYTREVTNSRVKAASRPKVNFLPFDSTKPVNYGWFFVITDS